LPEAVRLLMLKDDGLFLVHDDAGGYTPQNWVRSVYERAFRAHSNVSSSPTAVELDSDVPPK
jgi:RecB family endonuclease NucS